MGAFPCPNRIPEMPGNVCSLLELENHQKIGGKKLLNSQKFNVSNSNPGRSWCIPVIAVRNGLFQGFPRISAAAAVNRDLLFQGLGWTPGQGFDCNSTPSPGLKEGSPCSGSARNAPGSPGNAQGSSGNAPGSSGKVALGAVGNVLTPESNIPLFQNYFPILLRLTSRNGGETSQILLPGEGALPRLFPRRDVLPSSSPAASRGGRWLWIDSGASGSRWSAG